MANIGMVLEILIGLFAFLLAIPTGLFILELVVGVFPIRSTSSEANTGIEDVVVLIPAHNESAVIDQTITSLKDCGVKREQILVVADNCNDDTFQKALDSGVIAIERFSATERGKGYALAYGIAHLSKSTPPKSVLILDADCVINNQAIGALLQTSDNKNIVQSKYLMIAPSGAQLPTRVAEFFFLVKNQIRMLGLSRLKCSVVLTGSGMMFPWKIISSLDLATGEITEDTKFGLDAQIAGVPVLFEPEAEVYSYFPSKESARESQVQRWEQGNMGLARAYFIPLVRAGISRGDFRLVVSAVNLCIPPISVLVGILSIFTAITSLVFVLSGSLLGLGLGLFYIAAVLSALLLCWVIQGRRILSPKELVMLPIILIRKIPQYLKMIRSPKLSWVKTERDD